MQSLRATLSSRTAAAVQRGVLQKRVRDLAEKLRLATGPAKIVLQVEHGRARRDLAAHRAAFGDLL